MKTALVYATFTEGAIVYLSDGRKAEYVSATSQGHVVRMALLQQYGDEEYEYFDRPEIVDRVFAEAPVAVCCEQIQALNQRKAELVEQINDLNAELTQKKQANKDFLAQCAKYDQLKYLDDFINDRITHFVVKNSIGQIFIQTKNVALDQGDRYDKKQKLLTLFGDSNGNLAWKLNRYRDGSGSGWDEVIPCLSEQHAREEAQKWVDALLAEKKNSYTHYTVNSALAIGLEVPAHIIAKMKADKLAAKQNNYDRAIEALRKAEAELLEEKADA